MAFGVYVHIPYCVTKCPYCDFNSYGSRGKFPEEEYTGAILNELGLYGEELAGGGLTSVFFGGGTPSLFAPGSIEKIISAIFEKTGSSGGGVEVSLEVNPKTADLEKLKGLRRAGVNRISAGVQSFTRRKLEFLGRINDPDDSVRILEEVPAAGFTNYSFDLMYGTGGETMAEWEGDLTRALSFPSAHISAYCLTIENGTEFGKLHRAGKLVLPPEDSLSEFISYTTAFLESAGYRQYEISNYARPGYECRHNLLYWRGGDYIGVGAGAHSHLGGAGESGWGKRWANIRNPNSYIKAVSERGKPVDFSEELGRDEAVEDEILMSFRLSEGLDIPALKRKYGVSPDISRIGYLREDGFIEVSGDKLRLTKRGALLSDEIIVRLVNSLG
ncbi:MAG: radical SAM family heme chaperone HemW [Candidatus Dadabacteria bacterium]|nr:radical SAM family heme chaperone HemW [Candidatus Dadabacteria bacterium]